MSIDSSQRTGFPLKRNRSTGESSNSCLLASFGLKICFTWGFKVFFSLTRLSINESTGVLVFAKKLFILMLLLLGFSDEFSDVFGKWLSEMVNFSFNFKLLLSRELCFSKCFCSIFSKSFSQLRSDFDLFNSSILASNATRSALFLASNFSSKIFCFSSSNDRSKKSNFLFVRSWAYCTINFACSALFLRSLI